MLYHVDALTSSTYLNIAADKVHTFMAIVLADGTGLFQQENVPCHDAKIVPVLPWPPDFHVNEKMWDVLEKW